VDVIAYQDLFVAFGAFFKGVVCREIIPVALLVLGEHP
jgi:hypothetical protein